jgi:hypothetical protein
LESAALPLELLPYISTAQAISSLLTFAMAYVLATELAEFFELELVRRLLLILGRGIIATLTAGTI